MYVLTSYIVGGLRRSGRVRAGDTGGWISKAY